MDAGSAKQHEIGILFVHGIGEQKPGETLVQFGEPMCRWIRRWVDEAIERWSSTEITYLGLLNWLRRQSPDAAHPELLRVTQPSLQNPVIQWGRFGRLGE